MHTYIYKLLSLQIGDADDTFCRANEGRCGASGGLAAAGDRAEVRTAQLNSTMKVKCDSHTRTLAD